MEYVGQYRNFQCDWTSGDNDKCWVCHSGMKTLFPLQQNSYIPPLILDYSLIFSFTDLFFFNSFSYLFGHWFIHLTTDLFIYSAIHLLVHSFTHFFMYSFTHSFIHPPTWFVLSLDSVSLYTDISYDVCRLIPVRKNFLWV